LITGELGNDERESAAAGARHLVVTHMIAGSAITIKDISSVIVTFEELRSYPPGRTQTFSKLTYPEILQIAGRARRGEINSSPPHADLFLPKILVVGGGGLLSPEVVTCPDEETRRYPWCVHARNLWEGFADAPEELQGYRVYRYALFSSFSHQVTLWLLRVGESLENLPKIEYPEFYEAGSDPGFWSARTDYRNREGILLPRYEMLDYEQRISACVGRIQNFEPMTTPINANALGITSLLYDATEIVTIPTFSSRKLQFDKEFPRTYGREREVAGQVVLRSWREDEEAVLLRDPSHGIAVRGLVMGAAIGPTLTGIGAMCYYIAKRVFELTSPEPADSLGFHYGDDGLCLAHEDQNVIELFLRSAAGLLVNTQKTVLGNLDGLFQFVEQTFTTRSRGDRVWLARIDHSHQNVQGVIRKSRGVLAMFDSREVESIFDEFLPREIRETIAGLFLTERVMSVAANRKIPMTEKLEDNEYIPLRWRMFPGGTPQGKPVTSCRRL